ncbi:chaperonin Cpn60/TCP-1 [Rhizoclosmatium globosum]|uniref:CCT-eta n=1 Tax=Rhizoclosmatium globosum TaxID=329046 RepID=A0A1Y2BK69_9FUNG|nr:chaperonin Cpn60/TCP-1 [Rhizoclosmatium globosum]|eukprot:ORY35176.1 chaperonin Cpn60/TCP-1 [Rhizoclosmatium globosum]
MSFPGGVQPQIIILKEGTDTSQGKGQLLSNINACMAVADCVRTTLGPRGMDKLIVDSKGDVTISNDGATILRLLDIVHPAGKAIVDISRAQDAEVGDGTTSVTLLAAEFLKEIKQNVEDGVSPQIIMKGFRKASVLAINKVKELAVTIERKNPTEFRDLLEKCAATAILLQKMVVDSVLHLDQVELNEKMIGIKKIPGGAMQDSLFVDGVAFKKTFSYAGFEQQPKTFKSPKILCLNVELELKAEKDNAEVRIDAVQDYQSIVDAEWSIIYDKLEKIVATGAKIVLSRLPIGDLATQYFADHLNRVVKAVGGAVQSSVNDIGPVHLGTCDFFEEKQIGSERFNLFQGCPQAKTCTLLLRGGAEQFIAEVERSLHDAIMISVVAGGVLLRWKFLNTSATTQRLWFRFNRYPESVASKAHYVGGTWFGVDMESEGIADNFEKFVWEPALVKTNAIAAATEAACLILSEQPGQGMGGAPMRGRGARGRGRR